jgi:purine-nucleoside phosphorylase
MDDPPKQGVYSRASITAEFLRRDLPAHLQHPKVAVVCGSGLGGLADEVEADSKVEIPYSDISGFPVSTGMLSMFSAVL